MRLGRKNRVIVVHLHYANRLRDVLHFTLVANIFFGYRLGYAITHTMVHAAHIVLLFGRTDAHTVRNGSLGSRWPRALGAIGHQ